MSRGRLGKTCRSSIYFLLQGVVVDGLGVASKYVSHPLYRGFFEAYLGCKPYPGTLNVRLAGERLTRAWSRLLSLKPPCLVYAPRDRGLSPLWVVEALVYGIVPALIVRPLATRHPVDVIEIVSCRRLREAAESVGVVYVVAGCGLVRCFGEWLDSINSMLRLINSSL